MTQLNIFGQRKRRDVGQNIPTLIFYADFDVFNQGKHRLIALQESVNNRRQGKALRQTLVTWIHLCPSHRSSNIVFRLIFSNRRGRYSFSGSQPKYENILRICPALTWYGLCLPRDLPSFLPAYYPSSVPLHPQATFLWGLCFPFPSSCPFSIRE